MNCDAQDRGLKVLIAPDKFKGTLTAEAAAKAIARGWRRGRMHDRLELLPITDGGDGFGAVLGRLLGARVRRAKVVDAAGRECIARWWWATGSKTAVIESANVIGLAMLPPKRFHPFDLDTSGLGRALARISRASPTRCLVGIGGSATNDGGFGLARAVGWRFLGPRQTPISCWTGLERLQSIVPPERPLPLGELIVAVDVQNPLLGLQGATRVYGPQKGLTPRQFGRAERCLQRSAEVVSTALGRDFAEVPGAGAAGGLGFGLMAFLGARLEPGFELFSRYSALDDHLRASDLVITGEGQVDASSLMGKGVGEIARLCRALRIACVALAGRVDNASVGGRIFAQTHPLTDLTSLEQAKAEPAAWLERLASEAAQHLKIA